MLCSCKGGRELALQMQDVLCKDGVQFLERQWDVEVRSWMKYTPLTAMAFFVVLKFVREAVRPKTASLNSSRL